MSDWINNAVELGIEELIVSYLETNVSRGERLVFPYLGDPLDLEGVGGVGCLTNT